MKPPYIYGTEQPTTSCYYFIILKFKRFTSCESQESKEKNSTFNFMKKRFCLRHN